MRENSVLVSHHGGRFSVALAAALVACSCSCTELSAPESSRTQAVDGSPLLPVDIHYRSFSASAAIGPPAEAFAAKFLTSSTTILGDQGAVHLIRLPGTPAIPAAFGGDILAAVSAGASGGGYDAAYISGSDLSRAWGFLLNSGVPFGPSFDEFLGFLYGRVDGGQQSALDVVQQILDARGRGVVAVPIVGSSEQLSGYFPEPIDDVRGRRGIGLAGLCQRSWVLRYLPPGQDVLDSACDELVASGRIRHKGITFVQAVAGGGSLVDALASGAINGLEFATPLDDVSQLFSGAVNPGTAGVRYVHTPGWQQQFLVTWMVVNREVWDGLGAARQALFRTVARDHVASSYGENMRQQGDALRTILAANSSDADPGNDMILSRWPVGDQVRLRDATIRVLNARLTDPALSSSDRDDYARLLELLRSYVHASDAYWDLRQVEPRLRFDGWRSLDGEPWSQPTSCAFPS